MKEWKIRQEIYHRLNKIFSDDLNDKEITMTEDVIGNAVKYFEDVDGGWIYPSKSYMVAICYAKMLSENFGGDPIEYLNDPDILYGNDPHFVTYNEDIKTYDKILESIGGWNFDKTKGMVPDVEKYFREEFLIDETRF